MRYFKEDGTYSGQELDPDNFIVKEEKENNITFTWIIDVPEETEKIIDWHTPGKEPGDEGYSEDSHTEVTVPEEGHWEYEGDFIGTDYPSPSEINSHDEPMHEKETVSIIRPLTEEEKEERQREKEQQEEEQEAAQKRQEELNNHIKTDTDEITLNTDVPNSTGGGGPYITVTSESVTCSTPTGSIEGKDLNPNAVVNVEFLEQYINKIMSKKEK